MNNSSGFEKLKSSLATKTILKILFYTVVLSILLGFMVDGIYNDELARKVYNISPTIYYWCVDNKILVMVMFYSIILIGISFLLIRNLNNNILQIINAMDQILKEPEKEVKLPNDLMILEGRLNNIRADLLTNQSAAKEAMQKKDDLIMYMAHDLKTPLTSIIGYLTLLTQEKEISHELQEKYMKIALDKSLRVEELINQFFEITRYNLQDMPITKQRINLVMLMEQLVEEGYPMLKEKGLTCKVELPKHVEFMADGDKLARAFDNLLKNAINYSYPNTTIQIKMAETKEAIEISFKNKGDKIPEYKLEKIFEKFYRMDEARTSKNGGAGLGLAITKQIVELHKGKIVAKNEDEWISFEIKLEKE